MKIYSHDPNQLKEFLIFLANELATTREMNVQLTNDKPQLKQQYPSSSKSSCYSFSIGISAQKTHTNIEKLTEQQKPTIKHCSTSKTKK